MKKPGRPPTHLIDRIRNIKWAEYIAEKTGGNPHSLGKTLTPSVRQQPTNPDTRNTDFYKYLNGNNGPGRRTVDRIGATYPRSKTIYDDEIWSLLKNSKLIPEQVFQTIGFTHPELIQYIYSPKENREHGDFPLHDPKLYQELLKQGLKVGFCGGEALRSVLCILRDAQVYSDRKQYWIAYQAFFRMIPAFVVLNIPQDYQAEFLDYLLKGFEAPAEDCQRLHERYVRTMVFKYSKYISKRSRCDFSNEFGIRGLRQPLTHQSVKILNKSTKLLGIDGFLGATYEGRIEVSDSNPGYLEFLHSKKQSGIFRSIGYEYYGAFYKVDSFHLPDDPMLEYMTSRAIY